MLSSTAESRSTTRRSSDGSRPTQWSFEKRTRPHLRMSNGSWRVDETYVRVKGRWTYLYRAVDSRGQTIDFLLAARRDTAAAKRFFRKAIAQPHCRQSANPHCRQESFLSQSGRRYGKATVSYRAAPVCGNANTSTTLVEQDHWRIKRLVRPGLGFGSFHTARRN